jgi:methyl-accepting chemotaxis protein
MRLHVIQPSANFIKDATIQLGTQYFGELRPTLVGKLGESERVLALDRKCQGLLRLAHGNSEKRKYAAALKALRKHATEVAVESMGAQGRIVVLSREETLLLETLGRILPAAAQSYRQTIDDLADVGRQSFRGTAAEFRECLREVVDHLSPDAEVMAEAGFKLEGDLKAPTTRQKVRYVLRKRKRADAQVDATAKSLGLVEEMTATVARAIQTSANVATHVAQVRGEVLKLKRFVDAVLCDLLEI